MQERTEPQLETHGEGPAWVGQRLLPLLYHELRAQASSYSYALSADRFAQHLRLFGALGDGGSHFRPIITFDDGHLSDFEYALPALEEANVKAVFFITAGWTGRRAGYMTPEHLRSLHAAGHRIGAHGWSHTLLTQCSIKQLEHELGDARTALEDHLSSSVTHISLPGGRSNKGVIRACQEAGYSTIWTSRPGLASSEAQPIIGRFNVLSSHSEVFLRSLMESNGIALRRAAIISGFKALGQHLLGDAFYARLGSILNREEAPSDVTPFTGLQP